MASAIRRGAKQESFCSFGKVVEQNVSRVCGGFPPRLLPSIATAAFIKTVLSRKFGIVPSFGHRAAGEL